jgi:hypothetical protein
LAESKLRDQIEKIAHLRHNHASLAEIRAWRAQTERIIMAIFGSRSIQSKQFDKVKIEPPFVPREASLEFLDESYREGLAEAEALLMSFVEEIRTRPNVELVCPTCGCNEPQFIELKTVGSVEWEGGVPILRGKKESIRDVAYYRCPKCNRPFSVEISEAAAIQG